MTTIAVRNTATDFLRLGFHAVRRRPTLKWTLLTVAVTVLAINLVQQRAHLGGITLFAIAMTTALFTGFAYLFMLLLSPVLTVLRTRRHPARTQAHEYRLVDGGLLCVSGSCEALLKWNDVDSLHRSRKAIFIGTTPSCYLMLPRRSFSSDEEYQSFWDAIQRLVRRPADA
jgi:hypothetical protein